MRTTCQKRSKETAFFFLFFAAVLLSGATRTVAQTTFKDISKEAGIDHQFKVYEGMFGGGICVFDCNNDGFEDLYLTSGMNEDRLYLNNGDGAFTNIYEGSGLEVTRQFATQGVVAADVNRDGWVDLFITTVTSKDSVKTIPRATNLLFLHTGLSPTTDLPTFRDATDEYGLADFQSFSTGASFGDFNADGYPDLYIGNYFHNYEGGLDLITDATIVAAHQTSEDFLLLNKKGKYFIDVYEKYGLSHKGFGFGGVFTDFDKDGDQDLFVNNDFGYKRTPNLLLENLYPKKAFRDVAGTLGVDLKINSMGTAVGDVNEDGYPDYYFTNIRFNRLMVSQGPGKPYVDKLQELGMTFISISWGANFADFDNDGDLDLFVANGDLNPNCVPLADFYFENDQGRFTDIAHQVGLKDYGIGRGSVVFDLENDGDLDLLVINQEPVKDYPVPSSTRLYRNDRATGNWLKVALKGTWAESHGLGSRVEVVSGGKRLLREIDGGGSSHLSQNSTIAHFGLGEATMVDSVIVYWTGGKRQVLTDQPGNTLVTVVEPEKEKSSKALVGGLAVAALILVGFWLVLARINK